MELIYTARFLRTLKKLSPGIQEDVVGAVDEFKDKKNHKKLRLHKLHGSMSIYHAFSANFEHRIIVKITRKVVHFMDVGDHSIYS